jgi:uncharacterized protein
MSGTEIGAMLVLGGMAGIFSGMFGIGGGLVIVPTLIVVFELDPKTAVGTSLFALLLPTGLLGVLEYWRRGEMRLVPGILIALGLFCGAYLGARLTGVMSAASMKRVYAAFLIVVAIYFFWSSGQAPAKGPIQPQPVVPGHDLAQEAGTSHPVH